MLSRIACVHLFRPACLAFFYFGLASQMILLALLVIRDGGSAVVAAATAPLDVAVSPVIGHTHIHIHTHTQDLRHTHEEKWWNSPTQIKLQG